MKLVDVHCHLESEHFINDLDAVIEESRKAGLVKLITASIEPEQWNVSLDISRRYSEVECALGLHPWYLRPEYRIRIPELLQARKLGAVAIGELGLDSRIDSTSLETQTEFFEEQLAVALEANLPLVLHCRGAFQEMLASFRRVGVPDAGGIIHSFNGSAELAENFMKLGINFSIGGILTYRDSPKRAKLLRRIYPRHFLLETDAPDIPPVEARTDPPTANRPCNIIYNLKAAAEILERPEDEVAENTTANAARIFGLRV
jgi:TatD DNase family protein